MAAERQLFTGAIDAVLAVGLCICPLVLVFRALATPNLDSIGAAIGVVAVCSAIAALRSGLVGISVDMRHWSTDSRTCFVALSLSLPRRTPTTPFELPAAPAQHWSFRFGPRSARRIAGGR